MRNVILVPNKNKDVNLKKTNLIKDFFEKNNYNVIIAEDYKDRHGNYRYSANVSDAKYVIAIGGDGTFLQAVNDFGYIKYTKFVGINLGTVGFLTTVEMDIFEKQLTDLINENFDTEEYELLSVADQNDHFYEECLNDVVIGRNGFARVIELEIYVDGKNLYRFSGDGVLISTAVGSTAYNLSLNGPIIHPLSKTIVINPIAPHSIGIKPIVIPSNSKVDVKIIGSHKKNDTDAILTCDGRNNDRILTPGEIISISKGKTINVVVFKDFNYFNNLKEKLTK